MGLLSVGSLPAQADDAIAATADVALTGSGVPVTVDVLGNDTLPAAVASVTVGSVVGGDASNVRVEDDFSITFSNSNEDYPNSSAERYFKTATFTVPYTVTDVDGHTADGVLTVTVAGKPVSPPVHSWIENDPSTGSVVVNAIEQLDFFPYPQTNPANRYSVSGHGITVTRLISADHASAVPAPGGIELRAEPRDYYGNDIAVLELTDTWGRTVEHTTGLTWVNRAAIHQLHTKVGVGQTATFDLQKLIDDTGFSDFEGSSFSDYRHVMGGTYTEGPAPQQINFTPTPGFVGTSTDYVGARFGWAYKLVNPWQPVGSHGPISGTSTNFMYIDVQAPPRAADVTASTTAGQPVGLNLRTPATLPWAASTLEVRQAPEHGTVSITGDGLVSYQPDAGFPASDVTTAQDSFTFAWVDDVGQESVARATVTVRNGPSLADHYVVTGAGVPVAIELLTDSFGDAVTVTGVGQGLFGAAELAGADATYTPQAGFVGEDSFRYSGIDAHGQQTEGTVNIRVLAEPAIEDQHHRLLRNTSITVDPIQVNPSGDALDYNPELILDEVGDPEYGTVVIEDGAIVYTPDLDYVGPDRTTVRVRDAWGRTAEAEVTFDVYADDPPVIDPIPTPPPAPTPDPVVDPSGDPTQSATSPLPPADARPTASTNAGGAGGLASTGISAGPIVGVAGLLIVIGGATVLIRRRVNNA